MLSKLSMILSSSLLIVFLLLLWLSKIKQNVHVPLSLYLLTQSLSFSPSFFTLVSLPSVLVLVSANWPYINKMELNWCVLFYFLPPYCPIISQFLQSSPVPSYLLPSHPRISPIILLPSCPIPEQETSHLLLQRQQYYH